MMFHCDIRPCSAVLTFNVLTEEGTLFVSSRHDVEGFVKRSFPCLDILVSLLLPSSSMSPPLLSLGPGASHTSHRSCSGVYPSRRLSLLALHAFLALISHPEMFHLGCQCPLWRLPVPPPAHCPFFSNADRTVV